MPSHLPGSGLTLHPIQDILCLVYVYILDDLFGIAWTAKQARRRGCFAAILLNDRKPVIIKTVNASSNFVAFAPGFVDRGLHCAL